MKSRFFLLPLFGMRVESSAQQVCSVESQEVMKMFTVNVLIESRILINDIALNRKNTLLEASTTI